MQGGRVGSGYASPLTIAFRPVPLGFGIAIAMRPANWQNGFVLGHDCSGYHKRAGLSALGQMRRTAHARDWNKMWAAVQAPSNRQTCWIGSQISYCFERINLSDILPKFGSVNHGISLRKSVSRKDAGSGISGAKIPHSTSENGTKATSSSAQTCSMPSSGLRDQSEYSLCTASTSPTAQARRRDAGDIFEKPLPPISPSALNPRSVSITCSILISGVRR